MNNNKNDILNNSSVDSSKKKNKILIPAIIIICCIVISCIALTFAIGNPDETDMREKTTEEIKRDEEILANSILEELCINDYLGSVLHPNMDLGLNLLDIGTRSNMIMFFYTDDNLTKYRLNDYDNDKVYAFVRYIDYANEHRKIFGVDPDMTPDSDTGTNVAFGISNASGNISSDYQVSTADIVYCDINTSSNCFIVLLEEHDNANTVKFSDLSIRNNVITGNVITHLIADNFKAYLNGTFEFEYEKSGKDYIAKSLKITSIDDSYDIVDNE